MEASGGIRGRKRVSLPSPGQDEVVDLTVQLLVARCGVVFRRGFRLKAIGQRLYVQLSGLKVPLYLPFDADPADVQARAMALDAFLQEHPNGFSTEAWRDTCALERVSKGKKLPRARTRLELDEVLEKWRRLKLAEGVTPRTIERSYLMYFRRLNPRNPLSEESLLGAIERTPPRSATRRRLVASLRRLCVLCGGEWNATLLDPLQCSGQPMEHRPQPYFSDEEIEAILAPGSRITGSWRRVITLLAVYGLRPWEAWVAEPCQQRPDCVWVATGKINRHGVTKPRQVPPFHLEWRERFDVPGLWEVPLPRLNQRARAGARVNQSLRRAGVVPPDGPTAYGFRHAYARRLHSPRYRVTDAHAALFMGHTVAVHYKAYRDWLGGESPIDLYQ